MDSKVRVLGGRLTTAARPQGRAGSPARVEGPTRSRRQNGPARPLARLEAFIPTWVVLDIVLPDLSGFDVCREIRRAGPPDAGDHPQRQATMRSMSSSVWRSEADDYIVKPFPRPGAAGPDRRPPAQGQGAAR